MQEGSLRCDANVNLHITKRRQDDRHADRRDQEPQQLPGRREGPPLRGRSAVSRSGRRTARRSRTPPRPRAAGTTIEEVTKPQREKETAADYRYFPEPDLVPVVVDAAWLDRDPRSRSANCPFARRKRFEADYGLSAYDANVLVEQGQDVADYYDAVARATGEYKLASNWIQQDVLRTIKEKKIAGRRVPGPSRGPRRPDQPGQARRAQHQPGPRDPGPDDRDRRPGRDDHRAGRLPDGLRPRRDRRGGRGRDRRQSPGHSTS